MVPFGIRFALRKLASGLIALLVFITALFFLAQWLIPGDFVTQFQFALSPAEREALRESLGLHLPMWRQYVLFIAALLSGNFGETWWGASVSSMLTEIAPWSLLTFVGGVGLAFPFGHWVGRTMAWRRDKSSVKLLRSGSVLAFTTFPALAAFVLLTIVDVWAGREALIAARRLNPDLDHQPVVWGISLLLLGALFVVSVAARWAGRRGVHFPRSLGLRLVVALGITATIVWSVGWGDTAIDILALVGLPILAVAFLTFGEVALVVDKAMTGVRSEAYVQTARAKGLSDRAVRDLHAARVALFPVLSRLMIAVPYFLTGLMILEVAFATGVGTGRYLPIPGISSLLFYSLERRNLPMVVAGLFAIGLVVIVLRTALEIGHVYLDPRIRDWNETDA